KCYHGPITKQGRSSARWLAVEAAQSLSRMSTPLAATYHRVKRKRGHNVAVTALARKLVVLAWYLLRKQEPYRYGPVGHTRRKLRRLTPGLAPATPGWTKISPSPQGQSPEMRVRACSFRFRLTLTNRATPNSLTRASRGCV